MISYFYERSSVAEQTRATVSRWPSWPVCRIQCIERAKELVDQLLDADITERVRDMAAAPKNHKKPVHYDEVDLEQMSLFDTVKDDDILKELKEIDVGNLTPIDALNTIYRLQNKLKNRW